MMSLFLYIAVCLSVPLRCQSSNVLLCYFGEGKAGASGKDIIAKGMLFVMLML
jgi:hypothetical protein